MKKHLFLLLFIKIIYYSTNAQSTDYYNSINHIFGAIDQTKVTTGLLKDFGERLNQVEAYNGTMEFNNWVDLTQWRSLYQSLYSMRIGTTTAMNDPLVVYNHLAAQQQAGNELILLSALHYKYEQY